VKATGEKGDTGETGQQGDKGETGAPGQDGKDGVTPKLKIGDDNFWYISYDDGQTWVSLGVKATGEKGDTGETGQQGEKGDKGDPGADGQDGADGKDGVDGKDVDKGGKGVKGDTGKDGKDGKDGIGIAKAEINADGELVITYTDGKVVNLGKVVGADGKDGLTPFIGENGNWWIGEKDTGVKAVADVAVPAGFGNISEGNISEPASSPALVAIGSVAGVALLGNLGLILYIVLKKKKV